MKIEDGVRSRMQTAALELFREHGYERTTATQIAARAGVTERTFFRYFPDKREVLFDGEARLRDALTAAIGNVPAQASPLEALHHAFLSVGPMLEENRAFAMPRQAVIAVTPALQERELTKLAVLADALAAALESRDVPKLRASLAAQAGMAAFVTATVAWLEHATPTYGERIDLAFAELTSVLTDRE